MHRISLVAVISFVYAGCAHAPRGDVQLSQWNAKHPEAARELCTWVSNHPEAANRFFEWESSHPERSREFVDWTIGHPAEGINAFVATHPGWSEWDWISETHHPAANAFMAWVRRHPRPAEDFVRHPAGERWAAQHLGC